MKILLLGKNGQVGWELQRSLAPLGELMALGRQDVDLERVDMVQDMVASVSADVVVNASAFTAVDDAETNADLAKRINTELVGALARSCAKSGAWLVHYSSDYVFDGTKPMPYVETDQTAPQNVYGTTKLAGEEAVRLSGCRHLLVRTSWLHSPRRRNFVRTILRLAQQRQEFGVVHDQIGAPTSAELVADVSAIMIRDVQGKDGLSGTYNLAAGGVTSWHDYAAYIVAAVRARGLALSLAEDGLKPLTTAQYVTPARRPANSQLDTSLVRSTFGLSLPDWRVGTDRTIEELLEGRHD